MEVKVLNTSGKETGRSVSLDDSIFGVEPSKHTVYLEVKQYMAAQRQGTHKAKERGEIVGSTRKIKKQKGTGTARAGSIKNPLFRGGGRVFGPRPRNYSFKLNKAQKRVAKKSALSVKFKEGEVKVVEDFNFDAPKTKDFLNVLDGMGLNQKKTLFVLSDSNKNVYLSSRNLKNTKVVTDSELNIYDILNANEVIFSEASVEKVQANLNK